MIENDEHIDKTYRVINTISLAISILSAVFIMLYYYYFSESTINIWFLLLFVFILLYTTQQIQVCYTWLNRNGEFGILMKNPVINNGVYSITSIILGVFGLKAYGYFIGHIIGQLVTLLHMKRKLPKSSFTTNISDFKYVIKRNKRFVTYQLPTNLISKFKDELPTLLIKSIWGSSILGYYSITVKMLKIPSTFLANAIGRVFFQTISKMKREGKNIAEYVLRNIMYGMKIAILPMVLLMAIGDIAIVVILGKDWAMAGDFVRILSLQFFFMFLMNTIQGLSTTLEKQNYAMIFSIVQMLGYALGAMLGKLVFNSVHTALLLMSILFITSHIIYISALFNVMKYSRTKYVFYSCGCILLILLSSFIMRMILDFSGILHMFVLS